MACYGVLVPAGQSVLDVENLRLHYARTLEHWLDRFRTHEQQVAEMMIKVKGGKKKKAPKALKMQKKKVIKPIKKNP